MKKLLIEYLNIIGYTITGIIFGISFFLLCINFYHYKDVNSTYKKQESDYKINDEIEKKIANIKENISLFDVNSYQGSQDAYSLSNIKSRLNVCLTKIDTEEFKNILNKKNISVKDVYDMQQFYQINISNECLVKQLYELSDSSDQNKINIESLKNISPFLQNNINQLIQSTDYLQKVIKNNSSYSFTSTSGKIDLYDQTKDSYFELMNQYVKAIDYIYDLSIWFKEVSS